MDVGVIIAIVIGALILLAIVWFATRGSEAGEGSPLAPHARAA